MDEQKLDQQTDGKYFHGENIAKNMWTTVIGCIIMGVSAFAFMAPWFIVLPVTPPEAWKLIATFFVGFALLFMRDKITTYIDIFTKKKIDSSK